LIIFTQSKSKTKILKKMENLIQKPHFFVVLIHCFFLFEKKKSNFEKTSPQLQEWLKSRLIG